MLQAYNGGSRINTTLVADTHGYQLRWVFAPGGKDLRRDIVYNMVAYTMLSIAQYSEDTKFTGFRSISAPGGRVFIRLESYRIGR